MSAVWNGPFRLTWCLASLRRQSGRSSSRGRPAGAGARGVPGRYLRRRAGDLRRVIPSQLITSSTHFHRAVWGIKPANGVRIHVAGVDLIRNPAGDVRVLEDNVRVPSGVSYVMTNRNAMITAMPEAFANQRIRPVAGYPTRLLTALRKAAHPASTNRRLSYSPRRLQLGLLRAHLLARTMGVELVEGRDLECRRGKVFMRTTAGLQRGCHLPPGR